MAQHSRPLILAYVTLPHLAPPEFVSVAAAAGYDGVSVRLLPANPPVEPQFPMLGRSAMREETLRRLADTGLHVSDIEVVRVTAQMQIEPLLPVLEAAALLKARNLVVLSDDHEEARVADHLACLAERAAPFGLKIGFEFMAYVGIKTIQQADRIIDRTGRSDIAMIIDPLHLDRSGGTVTDVAAIAPERLSCLQFCDAGERPDLADRDALIAEARQARLMPGTGTLPLMELLAVVPPIAPIAVEVPMRELIGRKSDLEIASSLKNATTAMLAADVARRAGA